MSGTESQPKETAGPLATLRDLLLRQKVVTDRLTREKEYLHRELARLRQENAELRHRLLERSGEVAG